MRNRMSAGMIFLLASTTIASDQVHAHIEALRDDDVRWSAYHAMRAINRLPAPPLAELHAALDSEDWQQRQCACALLWHFLHPPSYAKAASAGTVTHQLLEVTIEGLRSDSLPADSHGNYTDVFNASLGFRMLVVHAAEARELLEAATQSDDYQQRFLSALALGFGRQAVSTDVAAPILVPHLRDNDIHEDAKWCVHALHGLGHAVVRHLEAARPNADEQQRELIELLTLDLNSPPTSRAELESRRGFNHISRSVFDPAVEPPKDDWMGWLRGLHDPSVLAPKSK